MRPQGALQIWGNPWELGAEGAGRYVPFFLLLRVLPLPRNTHLCHKRELPWLGPSEGGGEGHCSFQT